MKVTPFLSPVSIVIVNYNAGGMLTECVRIALKQAQEVVVVDNASTDSSLETLHTCFGTNPQLRILNNSVNLGFAVACNVGTKAAKYDYLLYLNPDCFLGNHVVEILLSGLKAEKKAGMVGGRLVNTDGSEQAGGRRAVPTPWRTFVRGFGLTRFAHRWPRLFNDFYLHKQPLPSHNISVEAISGACMLIKREVIEEVGYWDEGYFLHCEDLDLSMSVREKGWQIFFIPDAVIVHLLGVCSRDWLFVEWHKHKGMVRFYRKFFRHQYPGGLMYLVMIGVWLRFCGVIAYSSLQHMLLFWRRVRVK